MNTFEYRVIPAPTKAKRGRWVRGAATRFADRLEQIFNEMGADGWEYVRTDTLPSEERTGLTQKTVTYRNLLVFRKVIAPAIAMAQDPALTDQTAKPLALLVPPTQAETDAAQARTAAETTALEDTANTQAAQNDADEDQGQDTQGVDTAGDADDANDTTASPDRASSDTTSSDTTTSDNVAVSDGVTEDGQFSTSMTALLPQVSDDTAQAVTQETEFDALDLDEFPEPPENPVQTPVNAALALRVKQSARLN